MQAKFKREQCAAVIASGTQGQGPVRTRGAVAVPIRGRGRENRCCVFPCVPLPT